MKLSPMMKYKLAFWSITGPAMIPFLILVILAVINPLWFRNDFINWVERFSHRVANWRDDIGYIRYYYDKAHLFDTLKA